MARTRFKCQFVICVCLIFTGYGRSLPIPLPSIETRDSVYSNVLLEVTSETVNAYGREIETKANNELPVNRTLQLLERSNMRPGQSVSRYNITITRDGDTFRGRAIIDIQLTQTTRGNNLFFNLIDLDVSNVQLGVLTPGNAQDASFAYLEDEQRLRITPLESRPASYVAIIEYSGNLREDGLGLYRGQYGEAEYVAMNLHATNARRVFPCLDEPNLSAITSFTFEGFDHQTILSNAQLEENQQESLVTFRPLEAPTYLWGMVAHNLQVVTQLASTNARLYIRPGINNLHNLASIAISDFYEKLNVWTGLAHSEILLNQDGLLHVMALPDVSRDWYALSTVCIWEPYVLTEGQGSVAQRKLIFVNIAESMARQWFGYMVRIENWRYQWISSGLTSYAAYEIMKDFQTGDDISLLDMDSIFTTDVIQESLLRDSYASARPIQTAANIYNENDIRHQINGVLKYKAPAILRMIKLSLIDPPDDDFIRDAARILLETRAFVPITSQDFYDAIQSTGVARQNDSLSTWVTNPGYPFVTVSFSNGELLLRQRRFGFSFVPDSTYHIPITYTTESEAQFENIQATSVMTSDSVTIPIDLGEDWIIMNLQGQGYYRVNYSPDLWERIIFALEDPEARENIHLLNRASIVDDAFNLARAGELDYEIALRIALTMENELDYAVWRALIRNMNFLKKRLIPFVSSDDNDLDDEIYLRLIRRIVTLVEQELGFTPSQAQEPAMSTLTRGLVMDHACRSGYDPCIAAAVDLFYDPNDLEAVNPNIPHDLRPAVYCTMVMEGDESVRDALTLHMSNEVSPYERLVILQALACSQDEGFINEYLTDTVSENSPYVLEERLKIFEAVASSSVDNAFIALTFLRYNTNRIRNMYGGSEKLEEVLYILGENLVTEDLANEFQIWVNSIDSMDSLDDSRDFALRVRDNAMENIRWNNNHLQEIYEWIDLNHAPSVIVSSLLLSVSLIVTLFIN